MTEERKPKKILQTILYLLPIIFFACFCYGLRRLSYPTTVEDNYVVTETIKDAPYILWGSIVSFNVSLYCLFHRVQK